jgi:hypothetical protein
MSFLIPFQSLAIGDKFKMPEDEEDATLEKISASRYKVLTGSGRGLKFIIDKKAFVRRLPSSESARRSSQKEIIRFPSKWPSHYGPEDEAIVEKLPNGRYTLTFTASGGGTMYGLTAKQVLAEIRRRRGRRSKTAPELHIIRVARSAKRKHKGPIAKFLGKVGRNIKRAFQ